MAFGEIAGEFRPHSLQHEADQYQRLLSSFAFTFNERLYIKGQTEEYLDVFRSSGGKYLETYRTPTLSWQEVKALKVRLWQMLGFTV